MPHADIEQDIQAKGLNAPRVTPQALESEIASEHYFTGAEGALGAYKMHGDKHQGSAPSAHNDAALRRLTLCVLVLRNGFIVTGESACASPENYDAQLGRKIARGSAVNKMYPLLGFRLRDQLHHGQAVQ